MATDSAGWTADQPPPRTLAEDLKDIAKLSNTYFVSVFSPITRKVSTPPENQPIMTELCLTLPVVQAVLVSLDVTKATGPDEIPARLLKETASTIASSLCQLFNESLSTGSLPQE